MKKLLLAMVLTTPLWATPTDIVYHQLPDPSCKLVNLGNRWVIQDAKGFFVGYYQPAPPKNTYVPPARPAARRPSGGSSTFGFSPGYNNNYGYGYGNYYSPYGYGYGYRGGYNSGYYNNYSRPCHTPAPAPQRAPEPVRAMIPIR